MTRKHHILTHSKIGTYHFIICPGSSPPRSRETQETSPDVDDTHIPHCSMILSPSKVGFLPTLKDPIPKGLCVTIQPPPPRPQDQSIC